MSLVEADHKQGKVFLIATGAKTPQQALALIERLVGAAAEVYPEGTDAQRITKMMLTRTTKELQREQARV